MPACTLPPSAPERVNDYLRSTGMDALTGADIVKVAPERYSSNVEYPNTSIANHLRDIAQVYLADLGTRIFYTQHGSFDTTTPGEMAEHPQIVAGRVASGGGILRGPAGARPAERT